MLPKRHDADFKDMRCLFAWPQSPVVGQYRFGVVPRDSYGVRGAAAFSPWQDVRPI